MTQIKECHSPKLVSAANVTIAIKGLAISNFNQKNQNWETVFPRHVEHHNLSITVNKCRSGTLESSRTYAAEPNEKIYVRTNVANSQPIHFAEQNEKNLSHIIDFSAADMYDKKINFHKKPGVALTFLSISGSVFYTKKLSNNIYNILKASEIKQQKKIGLIVGADIVCPNGERTEITIEGKPAPFEPLVAEEGVVYEIIFDNDCNEPSRHPEGDFAAYYDLIDETERFSLELDAPIEPVDPDIPPIDPPVDPPDKNPPCNATIVSELGDGMASLAELLNS